MTRRPPDAHEPFARWLLGEGVDVVVGHSAHVFHGVEVRDDALVCYDLGDFVDDYAVDDELRNDRGFLFVVEATPDGELRELRLLPTEIRDCAVHRASGAVADWSRERMREKSRRYGTGFERPGDEDGGTDDGNDDDGRDDAEALVLPIVGR